VLRVISALSNLAEGLPALVRATRVSEQAAAVGFDWVCIEDIRAKITEELAELDSALAAANGTPSSAVIEEFGDLLVALVNLSRRLQFDAEGALQAGSSKFERRFRYMETLAQARGRALNSLSAAEWDELWCEAKRTL
jgi:nucleoside triphosphate diphosphatase